MSQATISLPLDSYNRLVEQANNKQNDAIKLAQQIEEKVQKGQLPRNPQELSQMLLGVATILRSGEYHAKAADPRPETEQGEPNRTSPKSRG